MSTKAHAVCMHTQRRVEQQLVIVSHLSKQWHHPHLGGGGFLLWGAACAPRGGDVIGILEQQLAFKTCANVSSSANLLLRPLLTVDMLTVAAHRHGAI